MLKIYDGNLTARDRIDTQRQERAHGVEIERAADAGMLALPYFETGRGSGGGAQWPLGATAPGPAAVSSRWITSSSPFC